MRPSNWYLTGFLIPSGTPPERSADADEDDDMGAEIPASAGLAEESNEECKAAKKGFFPSSMGLSFLVPKVKTTPDQLVRRFAEHFWTTDWPGSVRPLVFYDPRALDPDGPAGVLHAKAVVVDDEAVFVTSANLTEAALDRNIEMGLFVRDRGLAASVSSHFRGLIDRELLRPLPAN